MKAENIQLFVQLCETFLPEASSAMALINGKPGGKEVVKYLHTTKSLAHDQDFKEIGKISWSELKDSRYGKWVIIYGDKGVGAIKATNGAYQSIASDGSNGGQVYTYSNDRGGNNIDFLKSHIGALRKFFTGADTGEVRKTQSTRSERNAPVASASVSRHTLIDKFRPLWARAIEAAIADGKGHVQNMIKNDAFEKAKKKLNQIESLQNGLEVIQSGNTNGAPDFIETAVNSAILMTAAHFYPEETGEIRKSGYSGKNYSSQFEAGPRRVLKDIEGGDSSKLGTILTFFKRSLISG